MTKTTSKKKPIVGIFTSDEGHLSIAKAVAEKLKGHATVKMFQHRDIALDFYLVFYYLFPSLNRIPYDLFKNKKLMDTANAFLEKKYAKRIERFCKKNKLDVCINTYFFYNSCLEKITASLGLKYINVLADPRSIYPMALAQQPAVNLVFDQKTEKISKRYAPHGNNIISSWFVSNRFAPTNNVEKLRVKLKLHPTMFTVLIASGSEGTLMIAKMLPLLFTTSKPVQVVVACGKNKMLYRSMIALKNILSLTNKQSQFHPLRFSPAFHEYVQVADIVVGKAGPNTIFEAVASLTPFMAITHISGQEDGNLDIIREYKLGFVEEHPLRAAKLLKDVVEHPEKLRKFEKPLQEMAEMLQQAGKKVIKVIENGSN